MRFIIGHYKAGARQQNGNNYQKFHESTTGEKV
jgi:hypothetical protein